MQEDGVVMEFREINHDNYDLFRDLMTNYLREGEDQYTAQDVIDHYVAKLFDMMNAKDLFGRLGYEGEKEVGFILYMKDTKESDYSEKPGFGTIAEIGLKEEHRNKGIGKIFVDYAETQLNQLGVEGCYVSAYGPAQSFWKRCGYIEKGETASNGLPIYVK